MTLVQSYLHQKTQREHEPERRLQRGTNGRTDPVAADRGEHQRVALLAVPVELDPKQRLSVVLLHRERGHGEGVGARRRHGAGTGVLLTRRLLTHLKEYLHFLDRHLPFPQLFLPGALAVLVGVSGRSALVPLSTLTASSCRHHRGSADRHPHWVTVGGLAS